MKNNPQPEFKVAVAQVASVFADTAATIDKMSHWAEQAAAGGAKIVLFPEAFVGGYPRGTTFGTTMGNRSDHGREMFRQYFDNAIDAPGPACSKIGELAARLGIMIVTGAVERVGTTLYCSVLFFDETGELLGRHRKLMPTAAERLIWGYGDGSTISVFDTRFGRVGAAICWENYMPLLRMAYYSKGIQIYCAPTADGRESWIPTMRHIAMEGRCYVLSCNQFCLRSDYPEDYDSEFGDDPATVVTNGGSCIIHPSGEILAGPVRDKEALLFADVALDDIKRWKFDFDVVGHYARPDVLSLNVNSAPQDPARWAPDAPR